MTQGRTALPLFLLLLCLIALVSYSLGQTETATLSGLITDPQGKVVPDVAVEVTNVDTNVSVRQTTNGAGLYVVVGLKPGRYRISVTREGFRRIDLTGLVLNVQDVLSRNFQLQLGPVTASITVVADEAKINTESATVSTVVDRNFADNLPMNGRSFQTLIQLTPGVVVAPSSISDGGQFNVNGQRAASNYWMVDGVSANIGIASYSVTGNGLGGALGSFSAQGGTNSLVSVDAMQEFRIQTSTYAPEFGRTPGGQISIVTRSGTNQFHGSAFDYLRNDLFDANDWFADNAGLKKPEERQNDFGGTVSGPILKNRTFFFFSYEGLRLRLPQVAQTTVPDVTARQDAVPAMQPFLNVFPLPNPGAPDDVTNHIAPFNASYSNPANLNAYSIRIDHKLGEKLTLFGRYNNSPSYITLRGANSEPLNNLFSSSIKTQTATLGATWLISPAITNDLRFNYSRTAASSNWYLDTFGGAVPLASLPFTAPYTDRNGVLFFAILSLTQGVQYAVGQPAQNLQRQFNVVDNLAIQKGSHSFKFGVDYRRLSPVFSPLLYAQSPFFLDVPSAESGNANGGGFVLSGSRSTFLFHNLGAFAQDTWRIVPRLTLTYGLRWDVDFAPSTSNGPNIPAVTGFNLNDLSNLALAPPGMPPFKTSYDNVAARMGVAYQLRQSQDWQTVFRGGFGVFYDLADGELGNLAGFGAYPFGAINSFSSAAFPLDPTTAAPPQILPPNASNQGTLTAFDPNLRLPYTLEWNVALEQALGVQQALSTSYIGSVGRRLIQSAIVNSPNPNLGSAYLVANTATSDYHALQFQFQRRLAHGLQALASYTWSHSIDTASAGSIFGNGANALLPGLTGLNPNSNRGASDFDIRNAFSAGVTYDIPTPRINTFAKAILRGWSLQNVVQARSASPTNVFESAFSSFYLFAGEVRPDVVPGQPLYLYGPKYPGGKAFNPAAFTNPPMDPNTGAPLRQGDFGRNALRGFGATQWDFAVHRDFPIHESLKLQFRAEMFNVLNHPNFGPPQGCIGCGNFGQSTQTLGQSLGANVGNGGFQSLYQIGGPRSIQLAMRLSF